MSYVKVIEKLEKQGKRKKELKQQKAEAKAKQQEELTVKQTEQTTLNQTEEVTFNLNQEAELNKDIKNSEQVADKIDQSDQEIVNIIESSNACNQNIDKVATDSGIATTLPDTLKVKSPDFSFVDLSIKPRQTLNLIQRNLSSPSYSMQLADLNNNCMEVPNVYSDKQEQQYQKPQHPLVNPKKRWLKCSEASSVGQSSVNQETLDTAVSQPPKKRRHIFIDVDEPADLRENTRNYILKAYNQNYK